MVHKVFSFLRSAIKYVCAPKDLQVERRRKLSAEIIDTCLCLRQISDWLFVRLFALVLLRFLGQGWRYRNLCLVPLAQ
ncbi:hypothetical protein DY000_02003928 [Brassica cretica]|uniref:Uncharacterized protein n=1 Tax=Brassica cretica TaxID=69181 RepID=A0ABQ7CC55_BRACR|nr:hypothetical protein DY000_02003928 [Brassica cretica]